jgi:putative transposase
MLGMMSALEGVQPTKRRLIMTQRFRKLSHSLYECKYHIVFCPKYRYRIFKEVIGETVRQLVYQLCKQKEQIEVLELNVQPDHVHLVVSIPPKYSVSEFMGYLKGKMALRLFQQYESQGRRYWGRHLWARGYCVSTIGLDEEKIRKYVQWQEKQEKQVEVVQGKLFD